MNHQAKEQATNCNITSPLPSYGKMLPSEVFTPQSITGLVSVSSIGDDEDSLAFVSPRDRRKMLLLFDIRKRSSLANDEEEENKKELSQREKRNSSIPMMLPQRQKSGDLHSHFQNLQSPTTTTINRTAIVPSEEHEDCLSDCEESLYYDDEEDDEEDDPLGLSKREKFNSSFPMLKPQRKKSGDLLHYIRPKTLETSKEDQDGETKSTEPTSKEEDGDDEDSLPETKECLLHGTYYYSDCEESLNGTEYDDDDDDLEVSKREKFNSSFPMLKPQRRNSMDPFSPFRTKQPLRLTRSTTELPNMEDDGGEPSLHLSTFYDDDDEKKETSQREKRNSSIPMLKPQRKKSGDLLSHVRKPQSEEEKDDDCDSSDCEEEDDDESLMLGTHYDDIPEDTTIAEEDLEEDESLGYAPAPPSAEEELGYESLGYESLGYAPAAPCMHAKWSPPKMAGLLHKPMRKSSMGHCTPALMRSHSRSHSSRSTAAGGASHSFHSNYSISTHSTATTETTATATTATTTRRMVG